MRNVDNGARSSTRGASRSGTWTGSGAGTRPNLRVRCAAPVCWLLCRAAARPGPPQARTRGRSAAPLRRQPGVLKFDSGSRLAEAGEDVLHPGGIGRAGRAGPALDELTRLRQEGTPIARAQPAPCRNRQPVEVVADELLRSGLHAPIIPLLRDVVEPAPRSRDLQRPGTPVATGPGNGSRRPRRRSRTCRDRLLALTMRDDLD